MKKYLVLTIDVEPDCSPTWHYSNPLTFRGVSTGIDKILQPLFAEYGIVPTYLINNVVLEDADSVHCLQSQKGLLELGTHLHPEFIDPGKEFSDYAGRKAEANCCFYEPETEFQKISSITRLFERCFSYRPRSFRAGRYSAGPNTISSLLRLGYKVDTSVSPHICWNDSSRQQPVDFSSALEQPYFVQPGTILKPTNDASLLEVPISITLQKRNTIKELISSVAGIRHPFREFRPVWLRPFYSSAIEMIMLAEDYTRRHAASDIMVLNMMFHNVEIMPGLNPYTGTKADCDRYLDSLKEFFEYCNRQNFECSGISNLYEQFRK